MMSWGLSSGTSHIETLRQGINMKTLDEHRKASGYKLLAVAEDMQLFTEELHETVMIAYNMGYDAGFSESWSESGVSDLEEFLGDEENHQKAWKKGL